MVRVNAWLVLERRRDSTWYMEEKEMSKMVECLDENMHTMS